MLVKIGEHEYIFSRKACVKVSSREWIIDTLNPREKKARGWGNMKLCFWFYREKKDLML